jgi:hypothetical protein
MPPLAHLLSVLAVYVTAVLMLWVIERKQRQR